MTNYYKAYAINHYAVFCPQHLQNISEQYSVCEVFQYGYQYMLSFYLFPKKHRLSWLMYELGTGFSYELQRFKK